MNELVIINKKEPVTTSLIVADGTLKTHQSVFRLIKRHETDLKNFGLLDFRRLKQKTGRPIEYYYLNEQQVTFLITLMTNNSKVTEFKINLVKQFYKMQKQLSEIAIRQQNTEWLEAREDSKRIRLQETDVIKSFVDYAMNQGSKNAARYYGNITTMENKALFMLQQESDNIRQLLTGKQLFMISAADHIVEIAIKEGMQNGMFYKDIYKLAKERVETFASMIPKTPVPMVSIKLLE